MKGTVISKTFNSKVLEGNNLGDPFSRRLPIYLPPGYGDGKKYPAVMVLAGYSGRGQSMLNVSPWRETLPSTLDKLINSNKIRPMVVVMPDCWTRLGGSQYLDSYMGKYQSYLLEIREYVTKKCVTLDAWGVIGHSSGGYGALQLGLREPSLFPFVADHAGDKVFDLCYRSDFPAVSSACSRVLKNIMCERELVSYALEDWPKAGLLPGDCPEQPDFALMSFIANCAAYGDPNRIEIPLDLTSCEVDEQKWSKWLIHDPMHQVQRSPDDISQIKLLYLDCGDKDEYNLQYCARQFANLLREQGVNNWTYEEFSGGHRGTSYRYERSLELFSYASKDLA